jgi:hypothetical protein
MGEVSYEAGKGFSGYRSNLLNKSPKNKVQIGCRKDDKGALAREKARDGHEVFSAVTGGRPLSFSLRINGGNRSSPAPKEWGRMRRGQDSPVDTL